MTSARTGGKPLNLLTARYVGSHSDIEFWRLTLRLGVQLHVQLRKTFNYVPISLCLSSTHRVGPSSKFATHVLQVSHRLCLLLAFLGSLPGSHMPQVPSAGTVPRYVGFLWRSEGGLDNRAKRDKTGKTTPLLFSQRVEAQLSGTEKERARGWVSDLIRRGNS